MSKNIIIFHVNREYFNEIKSGKKNYEYRLYNDYWKKRLVNRKYDEVHFNLGYPKKDDNSKIIKRKYLGWELRGIRHKHFGNIGATDKQVDVFAILTNGDEII